MQLDHQTVGPATHHLFPRDSRHRLFGFLEHQSKLKSHREKLFHSPALCLLKSGRIQLLEPALQSLIQ